MPTPPMRGSQIHPAGIKKRPNANQSSDPNANQDEATKIRNKIIQIALGEVGYKAGAGEANKYGPAEDWCALFVMWVYKHAGVKLPSTASALADSVMGKSKTTGPTPGDAIHFLGHHVEICVEAKGDNIRTVSGNSGGGNGAVVHRPWYNIQQGFGLGPVGRIDEPVPGGTPSDPSGSPGGAGNLENARAAIFATQFEFASIEDFVESNLLTGQKSLMNDKPLFSFIEQLCQGSMRQFQSMPNGNFYAFFADYFGEWGVRDPYWQIYDIEILDGRIDLNDDALVTHQYVVGDTMPGGDDLFRKLASTGVVTLFDAGVADFFTGTSREGKAQQEAKDQSKLSRTSTDKSKDTQKQVDTLDAPLFGDKEDVLAFLQHYGARPNMEDAPFIRSPYFESFLAFQLFMLAWSRQFTTTFTFTFMPELYPGGIVEFVEHGFQCYIEEVSHTFDYENGFTTQANLTAPAATKNNGAKTLSNGMIRSLRGRLNANSGS